MRSISRSFVVGVAAASLLATGCVYRREVVNQPTPGSPPAVVVAPPSAPPAQRVVSYPEGRWELRGDASRSDWVWIPEGTNPPPPPPIPR
jgi:hypothetical protein